MKRSKITGIIGTVGLHVLVLLLLFLLTLTKPDVQEEGGVPVMLGNTEQAAGDADPYTMTEVDVLPQPPASAPEPESMPAEPEVKQPLITQAEEPSLQVKKEEPKKEKPKKEKKPLKKTEKKTPQKEPEKEVEPEKKPKKTEAEKRAEAERLAAQVAASKIAGAFGKGSKMGNKGNAETGAGLQGSTAGNSDAGKTTGVGWNGAFDLNGRSLGEGGLPKPIYNSGKDEACVIVDIVVNPAGKVIGTSINIKGTNTVNSAMRKAAEEAARKTRFNAIAGVDNQIGTITYFFKRKE